MSRIKWGGVRLGSSRIYTLAYANNILMVKEEEGMRNMLERLEGYLGKKGLELNVEKMKVMRWFRKGGERVRKYKWKWGGKEIEEVREFT